MDIIPFLIVCPLLFAAGFVDSIAGGGGLISLPACMIAGLPSHASIGTNKLATGMGTVVSALRYGKSGYVKWKQTLSATISAIAGAFIGAKTAVNLSDRVFTVFMLIVIPVTAIYVSKTKSLDNTAEKEPYSDNKTALLCIPAAFIIGIYDGFYGPGSGTFMLLAMTGIAHMRLSDAEGTGKVVNLATDITSIIVFSGADDVRWVLGLVSGVFCMAGSYIGTHYFKSKGVKIVKPIMIMVLVIFFIKVLYELIA